MTVRVEPSTDLDTATALACTVQQEHHARRPAWFKPFDAAAIRNDLARQLERGEGRLFIAYADDAPAGYMLLSEDAREESAHRHADRSLEIQQMSVEPAFRRRGVGRALVDRAVEIARTEKYDRIRLTVWADNETAVAFYESLGFHPFRHEMERPLTTTQVSDA